MNFEIKFMLPKEISPNPLLTSSVELRYSSTIEQHELLSIFYGAYKDITPTLQENKIPKEIREKDPNLLFSPDYTLSNSDYSISFSKSSILFENVGSSYKLWGNYYPFICQQIETLKSLDIVTDVNRIGVRYGSMFEGVTSFDGTLKYKPTLNYPDIVENVILYITEFLKGEFNIRLQITPNAVATKVDSQKAGLFIDIDASIAKQLGKLDNHIVEYIDDLHMHQKTLFFSLLLPEFIEKLNPKY